MYSALGVQNIEKVLPPPPQPQPTDPAIENAGTLNAQKPVAFPDQDHSAHIRAHRAFMSSVLVKTNPAVMSLLQGHVQKVCKDVSGSFWHLGHVGEYSLFIELAFLMRMAEITMYPQRILMVSFNNIRMILHNYCILELQS